MTKCANCGLEIELEQPFHIPICNICNKTGTNKEMLDNCIYCGKELSRWDGGCCDKCSNKLSIHYKIKY